MLPASIFTVMLLALMVDYTSLGPDSIRDRMAFVMGLAAIRAGWDGGGLDRWTVDQLSDWIDEIARTGNANLAQAHAPDIIGYLIGLVMLYAIGVMVPATWTKRLGPFARMTFGKGGGGSRLNWRLWACAVVLGLMGDLTGGVVGDAVNGIVAILTPLVGKLPDFLFGKLAGS